jgi:hypothetical protein
MRDELSHTTILVLPVRFRSMQFHALFALCSGCLCAANFIIASSGLGVLRHVLIVAIDQHIRNLVKGLLDMRSSLRASLDVLHLSVFFKEGLDLL